jgi:hypothetical protein
MRPEGYDPFPWVFLVLLLLLVLAFSALIVWAM